ELRLIQELDTDLDARSVHLGAIRFGDLNLGIPQGRAAYSAEYDLSDERGYVLQVSGGIDIVTGIATWVFRAIDADTGLLVETPGVGLLRAGETGELSYTVRAMPTAETGATLEGRARVIFGTSAPLETNAVSATLDAGAPTTALTVQPSGNNVHLLNWAATDDVGGSGIREYTVYVSLDGRNYSVLLLRTTDTTHTYIGPAGSTPKFLVLAADNAGNLEASPAGVNLSRFPPAINLGELPLTVSSDLEPLPIAEPPTTPPTHPLFLSALAGIPGIRPTTNLPSFNRVIDPFSATAFARGIGVSGAGIGTIG